MPTTADLPDVPTEVEKSPKDRMARSNRKLKYVCSKCGREVGKDNLKVKRVQFKEMGVNGPIVQSRVVAWLCVIPQPNGDPACLETDDAWNAPALSASPGMSDTRLGKQFREKEDEADG